MANKKNPPQRRSLNDRITAAIENNEDTQIAGITTEAHVTDTSAPSTASDGSPVGSAPTSQNTETLRTKKATTIMPKEVFNALQLYCTETDTPKHRAIYRFILDGLRATATITEAEYTRFLDMAVLLTTTYEKKTSN